MSLAVLPAGFVHQTLGRGLRIAARRGRDRIALLEGERRLSFGALARRVDGCALIGLHDFALEPGAVIAFAAPNCIEYPEIVAGFSETGAMVATINPRLTGREAAAIFADCQPRGLIAHPSCTEIIEQAHALHLPVLLLGEAYEARLAQAHGAAPAGPVCEWDSFAISYTSGTTGQPKGVMLSHRSRMLTFMAMATEYGCFGPDDHFLAMAPMYHGAGFVFALAPLMSGGRATILPRFEAEALCAMLAKGAHSGLFVVPTHCHRIVDVAPALLAAAGRGHRLRAIISNAAALPQAAKEGMVAAFGDGLLHETYGSTEGGIVTNIRPDELLRRPASVGVPFPGIELELRDEAGAPVAAGEVGELFCRSPYSFNGYLHQPAETARALVDGWVTVGDLATADADGYITIVDRKKDLIISGGVNIYPREIELVIGTLPGVRDVAVVGRRDAEWGEAVHAFVVPENGARLDPAGISAHCRDALAGFKVPRSVSFIDELPRNASGKLIKRDLRDLAMTMASG